MSIHHSSIMLYPMIGHIFYTPTRTIKEGNEDHTEYMAPRSFMWVTEMFVSHGPTPAVWPKGGMLSSAGGPCLSAASWSALLRLASVRSNETRRGVTGFGAFCRNKRSSPAGAKPGNTENQVDTRVGGTSAIGSSANTF